jgi:hypothetical protein
VCCPAGAGLRPPDRKLGDGALRAGRNIQTNPEFDLDLRKIFEIYTLTAPTEDHFVIEMFWNSPEKQEALFYAAFEKHPNISGPDHLGG